MEKISTKKHWQSYWQDPDHQPLVHHHELLNNLESITSAKGKKILEVGAGMGGDSIYLAKKGAKVTALDFTGEALAAVSENAKREKVSIDTIQADAKHMPFGDETFDIVFHQGFLEHFTNPLTMLLEQKRVLKKGGLIVIDVPQKFTTYTIKKHIAMIFGRWFAGWEREFSINELEKLAKEANLDIVKRYGWGYYGKLYKIRHMKLGNWYEKFWENIENSQTYLYLCWCIGIILQKA